MTRVQQPTPLPAALSAAPARRRARRGDGAMFRQHRDFVEHWHRVLRSRDAVSVWHYLWDIAHRDGRPVFVGADTIAVRTGVHERTVKRCVKTLEAMGLLEVARPRRVGRGNACGYRIPSELPKPTACGKDGAAATL